MSVLRFLATLFLLIAVVALIADLTPLLSGERGLTLASIEQHWKQVAPATYESMEKSLSADGGGWLWAFAVGPILKMPTFLVFFILAGLAGYAGRRRSRVKIYAN